MILIPLVGQSKAGPSHTPWSVEFSRGLTQMNANLKGRRKNKIRVMSFLIPLLHIGFSIFAFYFRFAFIRVNPRLIPLFL
jgi:hypothetical protein